MTIAWTKKWSAADDGTILSGADIGILQDDIRAGFGGNATTWQGMDIAAGTASDDGKYLAYQYSTNSIVYVALSTGAVPTGGVIMWSGTIASIPSGWFLCNGSNGTPDLRDRFIIAASADSGGAAKTSITGAPLQTGGAATHSLGTHQHTEAFGIGNGNIYYNTTPPFGNGTTFSVNRAMGASGDTTGVPGFLTEASGSATVNIVPTFYALAYIMKG